jgi:PAS domain S-box-containing protein
MLEIWKNSKNHKTALLLFVILAVIIFLFEFLYFYKLQISIHKTIHADLELIVQNKAERINRWRLERMADGEVLTTNYNLTAAIDRFIKDPASIEEKQLIQSRMDNYVAIKNYREILLVDTLGNVRLPENSIHKKLDNVSLKYLQIALSNNKTIMGDIDKDPIDNILNIDVIAPIYENPKIRNKAVAAFIFRNVPSDFLFPILKDMSFTSKSTETLLFRKDKRDVLYLSELKFIPKAPLQFRLPLSTPGLVETKAIEGYSGSLDGMDYRKNKVLASVIQIKGSPWYLEIKIDEKEALSGYKTRSVLFTLMTVLFLITILTLFGWGLTNIQRQFLAKEIEAKSERQALLKHFEYLFKFANDIIILTDENGNIIEVNGKAEKVYGYSRTEFLKMKYEQLVASGTLDEQKQMLTIKKHREGVIYESSHVNKQGMVTSVEVSSRMITIDDKKYHQRIIRDISERKNSEIFILNQSRLFNVLSHINQAVVRVQDIQALYVEACKIAVEDGRFPLAVVVTLDEKTSLITPAAYYGAYDGYLDGVRMSVLDEPSGKGPIANALTYNKVYIINNIATDPSVALWKDEAIRRGFYSNAIFPIQVNNKAVGAFLIYSKEPNYFHKTLVTLFSDLAMDVSLGLEFIDNRNKIEQSEAIMRSFFDSSSECFIMLDMHLKVVSFNKLADEYMNNRYGSRLIEGKLISEYFPAELKATYTRDLFLALRGTAKEVVEEYKGTEKITYNEFRYAPVYINRIISGVSVTIRDITDLKQAEMAEQRHLDDLEKRVLERTKQLQLANNELESFAYSISHDLRTPLRTIEGFAEAMEEDCGDGMNPQAIDYLGRIRRATSNMTQLIEDILNLSHVTSHIINPEKINLSNLVKSIMHEYIADNPNRIFQTKIEDNITVEGDRKLLDIAFHNILDNSIKFSVFRPETIIEFGKQAKGNETIFFVKDNGEGFDMKYVDRLFAPFQRLHKKDKFPGSGIGLSIVKRIINKHNGEVWIDSNLNEGTTIFMKL